MQARRGPGQFQWNAGGWFGSQLGGTVWMLVAGAMFIPQPRVAAGVLALCFVIPNAVGCWLWSRRDRLAPYPSIQWLIIVMGVFAAIAFVTFHQSGPLMYLDFQPSPFPKTLYWLLLVFPAMMLMFHLNERGARTRRKETEQETT
jgi:hypothetical protein